LRRLPVIKVEIWETFIRKMKLNPERFRPEDRMVGQTTYMVFGIKVNEGGVRYEENR
jgi:tRNA (adenine57-N1/adenine58-N1)-methyltransferase